MNKNNQEYITKSLLSRTRHSCLQMSKFFSKGVMMSFSFSSSLRRQ